MRSVSSRSPTTCRWVDQWPTALAKDSHTQACIQIESFQVHRVDVIREHKSPIRMERLRDESRRICRRHKAICVQS